MKKIITLLLSQGAANSESVFKTLLLAGIVTEETTARNAAALVVGVTAPPFANLAEYVLDRLNAVHELEDTLGGTLEAALKCEPAKSKVSQISVCQNTPWARISAFNGEILEFTGQDFRPQGIRTEMVISGGTVAAIGMKLKFPTNESGWAESK
jgi:hypothetical protein